MSRATPPHAIGVDIGGTKILAGVVDHEGTVLSRARRDTPEVGDGPAAVEDTIVEMVEELSAAHDVGAVGAVGVGAVGAVGVGAAGFIDLARASVLFSPHLSWRNEPLRQTLQSRVGRPVALENDANTAAWAEYRFGAAAGADSVLMLTLGTGIGGGLVIGGSLYRGSSGLAGEFGHMQVVADGRPCACGRLGCWEEYVSGHAVVRLARDLAGSTGTALHTLCGGEPEALTGQMVTAAARGGDVSALTVFDTVGQCLGAGLANLVAAFDPGLIVVGGGLADAGELLLHPARAELRRTMVGAGFRPEPTVVLGTLGPSAGFIGAADLARSELTDEASRS